MRFVSLAESRFPFGRFKAESPGDCRVAPAITENRAARVVCGSMSLPGKVSLPLSASAESDTINATNNMLSTNRHSRIGPIVPINLHSRVFIHSYQGLPFLELELAPLYAASFANKSEQIGNKSVLAAGHDSYFQPWSFAVSAGWWWGGQLSMSADCGQKAATVAPRTTPKNAAAATPTPIPIFAPLERPSFRTLITSAYARVRFFPVLS